MKSEILLADGPSPWHQFGSPHQNEHVAYARGYAVNGETLFEDEQLARQIHRIGAAGPQALKAIIPQLNGGWSFVVTYPSGEVVAAVDRLRTIPLFFYHDGNSFAIGDCGRRLASHFSCPINRRAELECLVFPYVTGNETLYDGIHQLEAGETIRFVPGEKQLQTSRYFRFYPSKILPADEVSSNKLADVIEGMFERLSLGFSGRRLLVPLSGGLDSRLIVAMLKRLGIDCLCYSYRFDEQSANEAEIARNVADALGFRWRLFTYTQSDWERLTASGRFRTYLQYGCKGVSHPNIHDWLAVMQFAEEGVMGRDVIFFPGHSADMNAGSHIPRDYPDLLSGARSPTAHIMRTHGHSMWDDPTPIFKLPDLRQLERKTKMLAATPPDAEPMPVASIEMWNAEQRQSKYIINSVRAYEYIGASWRTLWDYEFMDFFLQVPIEWRYGQRLYLDCLREHIFVGSLAPLAEIPLAKHGMLKTLSSTRPAAKALTPWSRKVEATKRLALRQLTRAGVPRRRINTGDAAPFIRMVLSGLGVSSGRVSLEEALRQSGAWQYLTIEVRQALKPFLNYSLDSLRLPGVYGTVVLAEMTKPFA